MPWLHVPVEVFQLTVLVYFVVSDLLYATFAYLGVRSAVLHAHKHSGQALSDLLEREIYRPVTIIVPAFNEERSIVASVRSMLDLHYPDFEVVVVSDGSTDATIGRLEEAFSLFERPMTLRRDLPTAEIRRVLQSIRHPNLVVIDKAHGGKSDALNAGLNVARFPLVAPVDSDSLLDAEAILRASRLFLEDDALVAVGGTVRPMNGARLKEGRIAELRLPSRWIERFQILEYTRAFFIGRAGWSRIGALLIISGAFGLFRRDALIEAGGYWTGTMCEDMEIVIRLQRHFHEIGRPCRVAFAPDPICWTEVPSDLRTLLRQRQRWHQGMLTNLWRHRGMLGRPRYGRLGTIALPYFWVFEALGPMVETAGYLFLAVSLAAGALSPAFTALFLTLALLYGILLSQIAVGVEALLLERYPRLRDRLRLMAAAVLEFLGYRQLLAVTQTLTTFRSRGRGRWGAMRRVGLEGEVSGGGDLARIGDGRS
jgi:cellulose synthase/poly-beta-1,6-N-acetylglucosamine synthase-like glycosyltransferase